MSGGSLDIVGTGIRAVGQVTAEARRCIEAADLVLYATDAVTARWIERLNPRAESLDRLFAPGEPRRVTYERTVARILEVVREGRRVCAAYYGHPGVFVYATHAALQQARSEGFPARMLPGVSASDCLFADLGVDLGSRGCQSHEATDFLTHHTVFDPAVPLILWQVGIVGDWGYGGRPNRTGRRLLLEKLLPAYGSEHGVVLYQAAQFAALPYLAARFPLHRLEAVPGDPYCTLLVPPAGESRLDRPIAERLGFTRQSV
jgi:precorrin-6B methylase 1